MKPDLDRRAELNGAPGLHAFICGVGGYTHLPPYHGPGSPAGKWDMYQLSSTTLAANRVFKWLKAHEDCLPAPLATCWLLLTPSASELAVVKSLANYADCTLVNFLGAVKAWREAASTNPGDVAFFYFAGHGVGTDWSDAVMLMADFADGLGDDLRCGVRIGSVAAGMSRTASYPDIAGLQLYFVDCCRNQPPVDNVAALPPTNAFGQQELPSGKRNGPIFYASIPGQQAYALTGQQTFFSAALLESLEGGVEHQDDGAGGTSWHVSIYSLYQALKAPVAALNQQTAKDQEVILGGEHENAVLRRLTKPPVVPLEVEVVPSSARDQARVRVFDGRQQPLEKIPHPLDPHPFQKAVPAGIYGVEATIAPGADGLRDCPREFRQVWPPRGQRWKLQVAK